ncbi:ankyrin repeat-containing domain protein, partial [Pestalotiopsis sp. NC0098]
MVELLLVLGADATLRNQQNLTVLHLAVMNSKIGAAKLLIARGADVNAHGGALNATPLHCAVCNENLPMVNLLLSNGATVEL